MIEATFHLYNKEHETVYRNVGSQPGDLTIGEIADILLPWVTEHIRKDGEKTEALELYSQPVFS